MNHIKTVIRHMIKLFRRATPGTESLTGARHMKKTPNGVLTVAIDPAAGLTGMQIMRRAHDGRVTKIRDLGGVINPFRYERYGNPTEATGAALGAAAEEQRRRAMSEAYGIDWPCIHASGMCGHRSVCANRGHCVEEKVDLSYGKRMRELMEHPGESDSEIELIKEGILRLGEIMAVRPSNEIVCCGVCGHPNHTPGSGRCAFLSPAMDGTGGLTVCRCGHDVEEV